MAVNVGIWDDMGISQVIGSPESQILTRPHMGPLTTMVIYIYIISIYYVYNMYIICI